MSSSPAPTVGLFGATGNLGSLVLEQLLRAHQDGTIKLVVLHRPSAKLPASVDSTAGVESRAVDADSAPLDELKRAVAGIQTLVSTVGMGATQAQTRLVDAVAASPDFVTFIPAIYGMDWPKERLDKFPAVKPVYDMILGTSHRLAELGLGLTTIRAGIFAGFYFSVGMLGADAKSNVIQANEKHLRNPLAITTLDYLAAGIAHVVTQPPGSIKNKKFAFIDQWVTGQEIAQALEAVHGSAPTIKGYTKEDAAQQVSTPPLGPTAAGYMDAWAEGTFGYTGELEVPGWKKVPLQEIARQFV